MSSLEGLITERNKIRLQLADLNGKIEHLRLKEKFDKERQIENKRQQEKLEKQQKELARQASSSHSSHSSSRHKRVIKI